MSTKTKVYTGSGTFNVREEMLKDTKDMLDEIRKKYKVYNIYKK